MASNVFTKLYLEGPYLTETEWDTYFGKGSEDTNLKWWHFSQESDGSILLLRVSTDGYRQVSYLKGYLKVRTPEKHVPTHFRFASYFRMANHGTYAANQCVGFILCPYVEEASDPDVLGGIRIKLSRADSATSNVSSVQIISLGAGYDVDRYMDITNGDMTILSDNTLSSAFTDLHYIEVDAYYTKSGTSNCLRIRVAIDNAVEVHTTAIVKDDNLDFSQGVQLIMAAHSNGSVPSMSMYIHTLELST